MASFTPGLYEIDGVAVGSLFQKSDGGFRFRVTGVDGRQRSYPVWAADLEPGGKVQRGDFRGRDLWTLQGHPNGRGFIVDGQQLLECDGLGLRQCYVWRSAEGRAGRAIFRHVAVPPVSTWPTPNFKAAVLERPPGLDTERSPNTDRVVAAKSYHDEPLPREVMERQRAIVRLYTEESPLYHEMNAALRNDNLEQLTYFGSYIQELREVFKTDHVDQLIKPFVGTVWRGITFPDPEQAVKDFQPKKEFVWPAFTSMTTDKNVAMGFGNLVFQIKCCPPEGTFEDDIPEFAPAPIQEFSAFQGEEEILFPPNVKFRVLSVQKPTEENGLGCTVVKCKTVGFDTDEGIDQFAGSGGDIGKSVLQHDDLIDQHDLKIDEIEERVGQTMQETRDLSQTVTELQETVQGLQQALEESNGAVRDLQERLSDEEARRRAVEDKFTQLQGTVGMLQATLASFQLLVQHGTAAGSLTAATPLRAAPAVPPTTGAVLPKPKLAVPAAGLVPGTNVLGPGVKVFAAQHHF